MSLVRVAVMIMTMFLFACMVVFVALVMVVVLIVDVVAPPTTQPQARRSARVARKNRAATTGRRPSRQYMQCTAELRRVAQNLK